MVKLNKKAETTVLWVIIGVIVGLLIVLPLFNISKAFFVQEDNSKHSFNNVINLINNLNNGDTINNKLITFSEGYILVGFKKNQEFLDIDNTCGNFKITRVNKPLELKDKGALCLCNSNLLKDNPSSCEKFDCVGFNYDIFDDTNPCNFLLIEGETSLKIKKESGNLIISEEQKP